MTVTFQSQMVITYTVFFFNILNTYIQEKRNRIRHNSGAANCSNKSALPPDEHFVLPIRRQILPNMAAIGNMQYRVHYSIWEAIYTQECHTYLHLTHENIQRYFVLVILIYLTTFQLLKL